MRDKFHAPAPRRRRPNQEPEASLRCPIPVRPLANLFLLALALSVTAVRAQPFAPPPTEMARIPVLLARVSKPSAVYCCDGICLGDAADRVLRYEWETDTRVPADFAGALRRTGSTGLHCRPIHTLAGKRILSDGRS